MKQGYRILDITSPILKKVCSPVSLPLNPSTLDKIAHLKLCFRKSCADRITLGLSAPQVGISQRFFIVPKNLAYAKYNDPRVVQRLARNFEVFINPRIIQASKEMCENEQVCLSVPRQYKVKRPKTVKMQYFNANGEQTIKTFTKLLAIIVQHEYDHLDGITIDDIGQLVPQQEQINHNSSNLLT